MGQLRDKRIVQSRAWLDPNTSPIPPYDYDYTYPISVYEAIKRNTDDNATNLSDELDSIYRLIAEKQDTIEAGISGNIMTWTGIRGKIGSMEVVKSINPDPSIRSNSKVVSERAVGDALDTRVPMSSFDKHVTNNDIHVSEEEKNRWNNMAPGDEFQNHVNDNNSHITDEERNKWNDAPSKSDFDNHINDFNNPHNVSAHQVGTYSRREIDDIVKNIQSSFFNYLNIYWDNRTNQAELVEYHPTNWNPNYILEFGDNLPEVPDDDKTYFALKPATDYSENETQDCIIYIKRPGMVWQEIGFQTMGVGDLVIQYPDTIMYVWVEGRFLRLFTNTGGELPPVEPGENNLMWRPSISTDGTLTWVRSEETDAPAPFIIKGKDGYTPKKGVDYVDGKDGIGVPIGGFAGELLVKLSDANHDTTWRNIADIIASIPDVPITIDWDSINGRPMWYNELGDNDDGFITQQAATHQFEVVNQAISELLEKINGGGIYTSHLEDFNNPHRVTASQIGAVPISTYTEHITNFENPHNVTAEQVGLGNVNNTSDMDKPISNAVQEALDNILERIGLVNGDIAGIKYVNKVEWDEDDTTLSFTFNDDNKLDVKIPIIDIFTNITFDEVHSELVITLPDGSENRINISKLIKDYIGGSTDNIQVEVDSVDHLIKATILPKSITGDELEDSIHIPGSPTTKTQSVTDRSTRVATTEFVRGQVIDNLISYETDRPLSANMGRILNKKKADVEDVIELIEDMAIEVIDHLESTDPLAALSANMGRYLDLTKAPRIHTSASGSTFGRATINLFGHARASDLDPLMDGTVFRGTDDGTYARGNHRHPVDTSRAPIHWPDLDHEQYEMTGEPRAVMPPDDSNDNRIATTEWIRRNAVGMQMGECDTIGTNPIKVVKLRSDFMTNPVFMRQTGSSVAVTFADNDYADSDVFMDVQNTGPAMIIFGGMPIVNGMLKANHTYYFTFDGTNWRLINPSGIHTLRDDDNSNSFVSSEWVRRNVVGVSKGESNTSSGNPHKIATLRSTFMDPVVFMRQIGTAVAITFKNEDRSGPTPTTLDVQESGPATILFAGVPVTTGMLGKNHTHMFVFDGINWHLINPVPGTGFGGADGIIIGPGKPSDPEDPNTPIKVINRMSGHDGITVAVNRNADEHGQVNTAWITINYPPKNGDVEVSISDDETAWAIRMGDGTLINIKDPVILDTTKTNCIIQFTMDTYYPANSPCQLVYRTNKAWFNVKEI